jgi:hypothetical protein
MANELLFLKGKIDFLTERLNVLEKNTGPQYYVIPVKVYDLVPVYNQKKKQDYYLLAVLSSKISKTANVIKVSKEILKKIIKAKEITFDDFIVTENIAERRLNDGKWVWKIIS